MLNLTRKAIKENSRNWVNSVPIIEMSMDSTVSKSTGCSRSALQITNIYKSGYTTLIRRSHSAGSADVFLFQIRGCLADGSLSDDAATLIRKASGDE